MTDLSRASAPDDGVARRTILAGAAWSIPVIATATVAPAASASGTLALAFDKTTYTGTACSTITGAYVTATTNGSPTTGALITVSLSNGYTFAGGSSTATGLSGTDGRYALPAISVPASGGTATAAATSSTSTASASVSTLAGVYNQNKQIGTLPAGVTATQIWGITRPSDNLTRVYILGNNNTLYSTGDSNSSSQSFGALAAKSANVSTFGIGEGDPAISVYYATTDGKVYNQNKQIGTLPAGVTATQIWGITRPSDNLTRVYILGNNNTLYSTGDSNSSSQSFGALAAKSANVSTFGIGEGDPAISVYYATTGAGSC